MYFHALRLAAFSSVAPLYTRQHWLQLSSSPAASPQAHAARDSRAHLPESQPLLGARARALFSGLLPPLPSPPPGKPVSLVGTKPMRPLELAPIGHTASCHWPGKADSLPTGRDSFSRPSLLPVLANVHPAIVSAQARPATLQEA